MHRRSAMRGFVALDGREVLAVRGGIDKSAQDALYLIGYGVGVVCRLFVKLFQLVGKLFER